MLVPRSIVPLCGLLLSLAVPAVAQEQPAVPASFDAAVAWSSFEKLLHEQYGYFDRAGVDGDAILSAFASRAKAARSDKEFVDTLQLVSYNFADPHFVVGPFDPEDWTTIPTSSDLPYETRVLGPTRKFVEYVAPYGTRYGGKVYVAGGHWTGSMGEGLMIGFDAIGSTTVGSKLAHLLGGLSNETIDGSVAKIDLGTEQLFTVTGLPRADYRPQLYVPYAERDTVHDPVLVAIGK